MAAFCNEARIGMVPQGGNTGLVGGQTPDKSGDEIIVSTQRLRSIREVDLDGDLMICEAGVTLAEAQAAAREADRLFPLSLASEGTCTIGGNVSTNLHPDLYAWLYRAADTELARELQSFLVTAALSEAFGYPALAKICHQRLGTLTSIRCRAIDYDVRERFWALDAIVDALMAGSDAYRARIAAAQSRPKATA